MVLADRYIYTLMVRDMVRGMDEAWLKNLYGIALMPDAVFYLNVSPEELVERNFAKNQSLDYWESGMDLGLSRDMFDSFLKYQSHGRRPISRNCRPPMGFTIVDGHALARRNQQRAAQAHRKRAGRKMNLKTPHYPAPWPESVSKAEYVVGVDLGGTKILAGVFDAAPSIAWAATKSAPKPERGAEASDRAHRPLRAATRWMNAISGLKQIRGRRPGRAGRGRCRSRARSFRPESAMEGRAAQESSWKRNWACRSSLENDCNAAMLGIYETELNAKPRHVIGIFIGTGIGGGMIMDGKLILGLQRHRRRNRAHGHGSRRPQMQLRQPGLL